MSILRKLLMTLSFVAVAVFALPTQPSVVVNKTQQTLGAKAKTSKQAQKGKKAKKKSAELIALENAKKKKDNENQAESQPAEQSAEQSVEQPSEQETYQEPAPEQEAVSEPAEETAAAPVEEQPADESSDNGSAQAVQQEPSQEQASTQAETQPESQPAPQQEQQSAKATTPHATPVNSAALNKTPGRQSFILKGNQSVATAAAQTQAIAAIDTSKQANNDGKTYANRFKQQRDKQSVAEYDSVQNAIRDSILSETYHFGVSFIGGRTHDKRLGDLDLDSKWGGDFGMYLFYRYYFNDYLALQGRLGALYRYARFEQYSSHKDHVTFGDEKYDLTDKMTVAYSNIAVDAPLTFKAGVHVAHTSFLFVSLAGGVTKSMYDHIETINELTVKNPSDELSETLKALEEEHRYPLEESRTTSGNFYVDDWEFNSWVGAGIDGKYVSLEYQVLIAASSTKDNHRFDPIYSGKYPTWRIMVDFSLK